MNRLWGACVMFLAGLAGQVWALDLSVQVRDVRGAPVADAVVFVDARPKQATTPAAAVMDQRDKEFVPHVLVVERGAAVTFPNSDNIQHHVYSFSGPHKFELPLYNNKTRPKMRFDQAGAVPLGCNIHDWMKGYVYVVDTPWFAKTNAAGTASLPGVEPTKANLKVWHPRLIGAVVSQPYSAANPTLQVTLKLKPEQRSTRPSLYP